MYAIRSYYAKKEKSGDIKLPDWLEPWYYVEKTCEFANSLLNYTIKREAFNAKYDRESECQMFEKPASVVALNDFKIPLVVDQMFWPGAGVTFNYEGKQMLNSYHCSGVEPCSAIDADGQRVIDMFMDHLRFTLRITSYNVCYTKLLRFLDQHQQCKLTG